jgi:hypothetical protein
MLGRIFGFSRHWIWNRMDKSINPARTAAVNGVIQVYIPDAAGRMRPAELNNEATATKYNTGRAQRPIFWMP